VGVQRIESFGQIARSPVKKVFAGGPPEGVAVKAMTRPRTQFDVSVELVFLNHPSLHDVPRFSGIIFDAMNACNPPNKVLFGRATCCPEFCRGGLVF
jgi:hypothetical protein